MWFEKVVRGGCFKLGVSLQYVFCVLFIVWVWSLDFEGVFGYFSRSYCFSFYFFKFRLVQFFFSFEGQVVFDIVLKYGFFFDILRYWEVVVRGSVYLQGFNLQ